MKKILSAGIAALMLCALAACGGNDSSKPKPSQPFPSIPGGPSVSTPEPSVSTPSLNVENISETMARIDEIIKGNYNLDLCGYPHEEEEILPPKELILQYQEKRASLNADIDRILGQITDILGIDLKGDAE